MLKKPKLVLEGKALRGDEQCGIYFCDSLIGVSNMRQMYNGRETPDILIFASMVKVFKRWVKLLQWY